MAFWKIIISGLSRRRLVTTIYFIQLILALTIGLQVYQVFEASIGNSMSLEGLKMGDAHMVINDLLNTHGASLSPLLGQVRWLVVVYLIVSAFMHAGIWYSIIKEDNTLSLWVGGATYFWKSLAIGLVMMILWILFSALIWLPYLGKIQSWMESLLSEAPILWGGIGIAMLWSFGSVFFFIASSFAKVLMIRDGKGVWSSIGQGLKNGFKKIFKILPILLLFFVVLVGVYSIHSLVDDWSVFSTTIGVLFLFFVQQLIVWFKIAMRVSVYEYLSQKI